MNIFGLRLRRYLFRASILNQRMSVSSWNVGEQVFTLLMLGITLVVFVYGSTVFMKNRKLQYITARRPWIVISGSIGIHLCCVIFLLPRITYGTMNCAAWAFLLTVAFQLTFSAFLCRIICLIASFDLTKIVTSFSQKLDNVSNDIEREAMQNVFSRNWIIRNRYRFTHKYAITKFFQFNAAFLIVPVVLLVTNTSSLGGDISTESCDDLVAFVTFYAIALTVVSFFIILVLYRRIRDVKENLDIKQDFLWIAYMALFRIFLIILTWFVPPFATVNWEIFDLSAIVLCLPNIGDSWRQLIYVSNRAKREQKKKHSTNSEGTNKSTDEETGVSQRKTTHNEHFLREFLELLLDENGFHLFEEFLQLEFSFENLLFWKQARTYRLKYYESLAVKEMIDENDVNQCLRDSMFIYDQFIPSDSPMMINISASTRNDIIAGMNKIKRRVSVVEQGEHRNLTDLHELFTKAENEILRLMAMDSYTRFKCTEAYKRINRERRIASMDSMDMQRRQIYVSNSGQSEHE